MLSKRSATPFFVMAALALLAIVFIPDGTFGEYELFAGMGLATLFCGAGGAGIVMLLKR